MKYSKLFMFILSLSTLLVFASGCERDLSLDLGDPEFEVMNEDGTAPVWPLTMSFNSSAALSVEMRNIVKNSVEVPAGWGCEVAVAKRTVTITSPDIANREAVSEGNITITAYGSSNRTVKAVIPVKAIEDDMTFACVDPDISSPIEFLLLESRVFSFSISSNVTDVEMSAPPTGWTLTPDWGNKKLTIAAPTDVDDKTEAEGSVVLTPVTARGVKGAPVTIRVSVDISAPVLEFDKSEIWFAYGGSEVVTVIRAINIQEVKLADMKYPDGWIVSPDIAQMKITITAPATNMPGIARGGRVSVPVVSPAGFEIESGLTVMLGICNMDDMIALADTLASSGAIEMFAMSGEIRQMADVDLSTAGRDVIVGIEGKPFSATYNGNNKKIKLAIDAVGTEAGLFHTLGADAKVHDLTLEGSIVSAVGNANIGGVAIYNDGAELNKINSSVTLDYTGGTNTGSFGGLVAMSRQSEAKYIDCHTSGILKTNGLKYFGALVGMVAAQTQGTMTDCSNSGDITLDYGALTMNDAHAAGCVGCTDESSWTFTRVSNTGNIDYNFGKLASSGIYGLGGVFGTVSGTFVDCFNTGNVIDTDGEDALLKSTRFIGGFAGQSYKEGYPVVATGCYNEGDVTGISNYIAGFIGSLRTGTADKPNKLTDCYNSGKVRIVSKTTISGMFGGLIAVSYQHTTLTRCKNSGSVIGYTNRSVGGLVGAGADNLIIDQCENSGMVYVGSRFVAAGNPKYGRPLVAGLAAIRASNPVQIINSKNTGSVTSAVYEASHVQSAYVSEVVTVDGKDDPVICDQATLTASAGASVTAVLQADWDTMVMPN